MDSVCSINVKDLHTKALEENVQFHHWHSWIERELNARYLKQLYTSKLPLIGRLIST